MALRKRDDVKTWEVEGEGVVYDPETGMGHLLNSTALRIWTMCDGNSSPADIEQRLAREYPEHQGEIHNDVTEAVRQLTMLGLAQQV